MRRAFVIVWWLVLAGLLLAYPWLPEQVGAPGKSAPRAAYLAIMLFVLAQAWITSHRFILWIGNSSPDLLNLPHKAYWMHTDRRKDSVERMATHVSGLGMQVLALVAGLYLYGLLDGQPIRLQPPAEAWMAAIAALGFAFALWVWRCYRLFPAPPIAPAGDALRRPRRPGETR